MPKGQKLGEILTDACPIFLEFVQENNAKFSFWGSFVGVADECITK